MVVIRVVIVSAEGSAGGVAAAEEGGVGKRGGVPPRGGAEEAVSCSDPFEELLAFG